MPETRFTEFPVKSVGPRFGKSLGLHRIPMYDYFTNEIKNYFSSLIISIIFDSLRGILTFFECHSVFSVAAHK